MKWLVVWLIMLATTAFVVGSANLPLYNRLISNGVQVNAIVVELTPNIHNTVRYEYQVGEKQFQGQRSPSRPNPPTSQVKMGESLIVYYDPVDPSRSVLGDPKLLLANEIIPVVMASLTFPTIIVILLKVHMERKQRGLLRPGWRGWLSGF